MREIDMQLTHKFNKSALPVFEQELHSTFISTEAFKSIQDGIDNMKKDVIRQMEIFNHMF